MEPSNIDVLNEFLYRHHLASRLQEPKWTPLAGGVASDIWRVDVDGKSICVKRALPKLKVTDEWSAPVTRNQYEWEWIRFVAQHFPQAVPKPIAHDPEFQMMAMEFLASDEYPVWKARLLAGTVDVKFAGDVGRMLGRIHSESSAREDVRRLFQTDELFFSLRLEPYLLTTAERHPQLAEEIRKVATLTANTHLALVHGDVSPKNILVGRDGPIFLDAECAWYGDPAFDLAFCLNHFLLKCTVLPSQVGSLLEALSTFSSAYLDEVRWESRDQIEARSARLLPMLFIARVDGKSPVEYLKDERMKDLVRQTAYRFIAEPATTLADVSEYWRKVLLEG